MRSFADRQAQFDAANLEAARIIAADPAQYPPDSLAARWATLVLARLQPQERAA